MRVRVVMASKVMYLIACACISFVFCPCCCVCVFLFLSLYPALSRSLDTPPHAHIQLGHGDVGIQSVPKAIESLKRKVASIAAGSHHSVFLLSAGRCALVLMFLAHFSSSPPSLPPLFHCLFFFLPLYSSLSSLLSAFPVLSHSLFLNVYLPHPSSHCCLAAHSVVNLAVWSWSTAVYSSLSRLQCVHVWLWEAFGPGRLFRQRGPIHASGTCLCASLCLCVCQRVIAYVVVSCLSPDLLHSSCSLSHLCVLHNCISSTACENLVQASCEEHRCWWWRHIRCDR